MIYLQLLWSFILVGLFSIGGGYAALPLIQQQVVENRGWLTLTEFGDLITISQMTPGPIALNVSTFVGQRTAGFPGAVMATFGCVLPSCVIVSILAYFYFKYGKLEIIQGVLRGLRPAVVALIASAGLSIIVLSFWGEGGFQPSLAAVDRVAAALFGASLFTLLRFRLNGIWVILGCGAAGGALYLLL